MSFRVAYYVSVCLVLFTHNLICIVKGQCTVHGCENEDSLSSVPEEIQLLKIELKMQVQGIHELLRAIVTSLTAVDRRSQKQGQDLRNLTVSFQQLKNQQGALMISQMFDQRSLKQEQDLKNLTVSFQQMRNQQGALMTSQMFDQRSLKQEQDLRNLTVSFQQMKNQQGALMTSQMFDQRSLKQEQDLRNLTVSFQQMKNQQGALMTSQMFDQRSLKQEQDLRNLTASFQQLTIQHDSILGRLNTTDQRLIEHGISTKNQSQETWKLAVAFGINFPEGPLPPIINNWIVLMHRFDGSLNFNRSWVEYRNGFGDIRRGEFWLGNEKIHRLTKGFSYTLRIEVQPTTSNKWYNADYATFSIDSESNKYTLSLSGFSGNASDSLTGTSLLSGGYIDGMHFSTSDADNDRWIGASCAQNRGGGWWFNLCTYGCLTGTYNINFRWYMSSLNSSNLRAARMMIKSK